MSFICAWKYSPVIPRLFEQGHCTLNDVKELQLVFFCCWYNSHDSYVAVQDILWQIPRPVLVWDVSTLSFEMDIGYPVLLLLILTFHCQHPFFFYPKCFSVKRFPINCLSLSAVLLCTIAILPKSSVCKQVNNVK